jgi:hypothetical protein
MKSAYMFAVKQTIQMVSFLLKLERFASCRLRKYDQNHCRCEAEITDAL